MRSPDRLKAWLVGRGLLGRDAKVGEPDLELALEVRDALRSAASANSSVSRDRSDAAGRSFGGLPLVVRFGEDSKPELASGVGGVKGALGGILADVVGADEDLRRRGLPVGVLRPLQEPHRQVVRNGDVRQPPQDQEVPPKEAH